VTMFMLCSLPDTPHRRVLTPKLRLRRFAIPGVYTEACTTSATDGEVWSRRPSKPPARIERGNGEQDRFARLRLWLRMSHIADAVHAAWESVLQTGQRGLEGDFYELGGDSLAAMELTTIIAERLNVEIPLTLPFEKPALSELVAAVKELTIGSPNGFAHRESY